MSIIDLMESYGRNSDFSGTLLALVEFRISSHEIVILLFSLAYSLYI